MLDPQTEGYILSLKDTDINKKVFFDLFGRKVKRDTTGKIEAISEPIAYPYDPLVVPAKTLANQPTQVTSTVGLFLFNLFCVAPNFGEVIPYINETMRDSDLKKLSSTVMQKILEQRLSVENFARYTERLVWLNNFTELLMPGLTLSLITPNRKLMELKKKLISENQEAVDNGDVVKVVVGVEKPLLAAAREELKNDPGWPIYDLGGKPSFGNNYKNTQLMVGPVDNPITGKFEVSANSLMDGIPPEQYHVFANTAVSGGYSRAVATQDGGAKTKLLFAAMQSIVLDAPGSDCGTTILKNVELTKDNKKTYMWRYIKVGQDLVLLTPENFDRYIDTRVKMRSPLYCRSKNICQMCAGDLFRRLGINNVGLTTTKITSTLLNMSLKKMHDATVNTTTFDPFKYIQKI